MSYIEELLNDKLMQIAKLQKGVECLQQELECLQKRDKNHPAFENLRKCVYSRLWEIIPRSMGSGPSEKWRESRKRIRQNSKDTLAEFDKQFDYVHEGAYQRFD
jgi:hypothetical protein